MADPRVPDDEGPESMFRFGEAIDEQLGPIALEVARGDAEIRAAALGILLPPETAHDEQGWSQLAKMAALAFQMQQLPWNEYQRVQRIDAHTPRAEFDRLLGIVRGALLKAPAAALQQLAAGQVTEEERPPMQFSADTDRKPPAVFSLQGGGERFVELRGKR